MEKPFQKGPGTCFKRHHERNCSTRFDGILYIRNVTTLAYLIGNKMFGARH